LWRHLGHRVALIDEAWPPVDPEAIKSATVQMVVQVNGKLRANISVAVDADEPAIRAAALAEPNVQKFIGVSPLRKIIIVPGKLVNIVV
jgi:leucyl-tRNA synthetase